MNLDDLICICTILVFLLCILDNFYFKKEIISSNKSQPLNSGLKKDSLDKFLEGVNSKYNIFIPNETKSLQQINKNQFKYFKRICILQINSLIKKINYKTGQVFQLVNSPDIIIKEYNNIKFIKSKFSLINNKEKQFNKITIYKFKLDIVYVSEKEIYNVKIEKDKETLPNKPNREYRKSYLYNKWII